MTTSQKKKSEFLPRSDLGRNDLGRNGVRFAFFGTSHIAVFVLDALKEAGLLPDLIITPSDKRKGRGLALQTSAVKNWALDNGIGILQPENLDSAFIDLLTTNYKLLTVCIVVDYGQLLPRTVLGIPRCGFLNVHPSLLPRLRGPSPIRSAILNDEKETGVTILVVDEEMDHGPIVAQKYIPPPAGGWPPHLVELEETLMRGGGRLLAQILPQWVKGEIDAHEQNNDIATYCEKIKKEDGLLNLSGDAHKNLLKIRAYEGWPGTYAFFERNGKKIRVAIIDAHIENNSLVIDRVKPESKREMTYAEFLRSGARPI